MTNSIKTAKTNEISNSQSEKQLGCGGIWSKVQHESYAAISKKKGDKLEFINVPTERIKLISSLYAQLYLEKNEGNPALKGRFYWAGLAAIAAKQVYCGVLAMHDLLAKTGSHILYLGGKLDKALGVDIDGSWPTSVQNNSISRDDINYMREKMLKGNLWLFLDIYPTHLYYRNQPKSFFSCLPTRNVNQYEYGVADQLKKLPYISALKELKNFDYDDQYIIRGFQGIKEFESIKKLKDRQAIQFQSLTDIAWHEQKIVLQACFYAPNGALDQKLKEIFDKQKHLETHHDTMMNIMRLVADVQGRRAVLTNSCPIPRSVTHSNIPKKDQERFYEDMKTEKDPKGAEDLYNLEHRMKFITRIANDYHYVMINYQKKMEGYLELLANKKIGDTIWN